MTDEIKNLLYSTGVPEEFGLYEVQIIEEIPVERIPKLIELLKNENQFIAYQAMLILTAWNIKEGFESITEFIKNQPDRNYEFEPHRIWGADNVYDYIADALYISTFNSDDEEKIIPYFIELLKLYGIKFFESNLKSRLLKIEPRKELLPYIINALEESLKNELYYQSSQLLPVIAKYDKTLINDYITSFQKLIEMDNRIQYNLDEVQKYL
ncbi:hypothetical protein OIU83_01735 [Flavobacterium sp. LS1R49]|uniref:Uncharacterized protein n=1 Tax=Flavobacterium shii TaxID=2987687 RepID=A0A9X2Z8Y3_9FLAO|nr:hypothetical protein [Flavobacterium shii]MCV9926356.1 hypothetical protein [Flavobacterium shii]